MSDFDLLLTMVKNAGSRVVRLNLSTVVAGGMGYTKTGVVDEAWAQKWQKVFDTAQANGTYLVLIISGWIDWNTTGINSWADNPLNAANGGPAATPHELFQKDSPTQKIWLAWLKAIVTRWQAQKNILAWEVYSEVNLTKGVTEREGTDWVAQAAAIVREADPNRRPITASLAGVGDWPDFYRSTSIDFINLHPYPPSAQLDRSIISEVRQELATYNRPVLIGESGLNADTPDNYPPNAEIGVRHAIWAGIVSGAMNGRALWWEDGYALYFPNLSWGWIQKYYDAELPAAKFVSGVDFSGFKPLNVYFPSPLVWGAAVGNEKMVLGWFRDANSEPPDWKAGPVISKQTVTITVPGSTSNWKVDFYSTKTGTDIISSAVFTAQGNNVTVALPDFNDDIAFKMTRQSSSTTGATPASGTPVPASTTDLVAGKWTGTVAGADNSFSARIDLSILPGCQVGSVCGTVASTPCTGELALQAIDGPTFVFVEQKMIGGPTCLSGGREYLQLQADGTLLFRFQLTSAQGAIISSNGILKRP